MQIPLTGRSSSHFLDLSRFTHFNERERTRKKVMKCRESDVFIWAFNMLKSGHTAEPVSLPKSS